MHYAMLTHRSSHTAVDWGRQFPYLYAMNILFVCTANITRSVMAEEILRHMASLHPHAGTPLHVESAGVDALVGESPDRFTQEVCRDHGIEVRAHKARQLTSEMIEGVDLVLCLAEEHKRLILGAYPRFKEKVFLLLEYRHDKPVKHLSVDDPTGRALRHYAKCFRKIEEEVTRVYKLTVTPREGTTPMVPASL